MDCCTPGVVLFPWIPHCSSVGTFPWTHLWAGSSEEPAHKCVHGKVPTDEQWGIQGKRTTPGVQQSISYLYSMLNLDEAAEAYRRFLLSGDDNETSAEF